MDKLDTIIEGMRATDSLEGIVNALLSDTFTFVDGETYDQATIQQATFNLAIAELYIDIIRRVLDIDDAHMIDMKYHATNRLVDEWKGADDNA